MGLTTWWLARSCSEDSNATATATCAACTPRAQRKQTQKLRSKWTLLFGNWRHVHRHHAWMHKPGASPAAMTTTLRCDRVSASVSNAKRFVQEQCTSLRPSLVQLGVPRSMLVTSSSSTLPLTSTLQVEGTGTTKTELSVRPAVQALEDLVLRAEQVDHVQMEMTREGCGGAYFVRIGQANTELSDKIVGIFKPRDEEYMAPQNPRGYVKEGAVVGVTEHPTNKGFIVGNGALRERAAYLVDQASGHFSGVPVTSVMTLQVRGERKHGSFQAFVESESSAEDMGSLKFSVPQVHKIGILDIRLFNTDRHAGNILLQKLEPHHETYAMTPIDHGFCLPSYKHLDGAFIDWMSWPQSEYPFTCEELDFIASLDATQDAEILRSVGIEEECITTMRMGTALLQLGADAGFSLHEIGAFLQRDGDFSQPSSLETLVREASLVVAQEFDETNQAEAFMHALVERVADAVKQTLKDQPKKKVRSISCFS